MLLFWALYLPSWQHWLFKARSTKFFFAIWRRTGGATLRDDCVSNSWTSSKPGGFKNLAIFIPLFGEDYLYDEYISIWVELHQPPPPKYPFWVGQWSSSGCCTDEFLAILIAILSNTDALPETQIVSENRPGPKRKFITSNHWFSGAKKLVSGRVCSRYYLLFSCWISPLSSHRASNVLPRKWVGVFSC